MHLLIKGKIKIGQYSHKSPLGWLHTMLWFERVNRYQFSAFSATMHKKIIHLIWTEALSVIHVCTITSAELQILIFYQHQPIQVEFWLQKNEQSKNVGIQTAEKIIVNLIWNWKWIFFLFSRVAKGRFSTYFSLPRSSLICCSLKPKLRREFNMLNQVSNAWNANIGQLLWTNWAWPDGEVR